MNEFKAVIFDMDGVILDSESICDKAWEKAAPEFGIANYQEAITLCRGTNKTDSKIILKKLLGSDFDADSYLAKTSEYFREIEFSTGVPTLYYAKESLERLSKKYRLALASSTRMETVKRQLKAVELFDYFEVKVTGDMVEHSKPEPEIYLKAAEGLGLKSEDCLAIEDSPNGIKSAVAAGMKVIMVPDRIAPNSLTNQLAWKTLKNLKEVTDFLCD